MGSNHALILLKFGKQWIEIGEIILPEALRIQIFEHEVLNFLNDIFDTLLKALSDPSDEVVLLVLDVHACIAKDPQHFRHLVVFLVHNFRVDNSLLEKRGALIIRRLCVLLDAERVYRELSMILEGELIWILHQSWFRLLFVSEIKYIENEENAFDLIKSSSSISLRDSLEINCLFSLFQALNLILLTSSELAGLRSLLKQSLVNPTGKDLFVSLYASWCHSPMAIISLCLLAQTYQHASSVILSLVEEDINVKFLVQLDKLVRLLETPIFAYLRLQVHNSAVSQTFVPLLILIFANILAITAPIFSELVF
ncbi:Protein VAC14-like [Vitis vinifera]|uniref:Protein VAC14-like n=1 Tax=Vitis vinifera TaxID=29760 RepID=A0A438HXW3_VITVI|nr:Protein VAC14-like [Vitis vinifera]